MALLFDPFRIKSITFPTRMGVSPMCMYHSEDGFATDFHLAHLGRFALGKFGLIIQEATAVSPEGRITSRDLGLWKDAHNEKLKCIVAFVQSQDVRIGIQLAHAGRKASTRPPFEGRGQINPSEPNGWQTVGPSDVPFFEDDFKPKALDSAGLEKVKADFCEAVKRSKVIGYDVLEIHAAHGYLLHQFLSPLSNFRNDEYGGTLKNRMRFPLEVIKACKEVWGDDKPFFVRISASDWQEDGWRIEDAIVFSENLKSIGVDLIDVSSGGNIPYAKITTGPGYQVPFSEAIKNKVSIATAAVGEITTAKQSQAILSKQEADLILYGREALRNPNLPLGFAKDLEQNLEWPKRFERGKEK